MFTLRLRMIAEVGRLADLTPLKEFCFLKGIKYTETVLHSGWFSKEVGIVIEGEFASRELAQSVGNQIERICEALE